MINEQTVLDELVRASTLLSGEFELKPLISVLVEQSLDITHSDVAALYLYKNDEAQRSDLKMMYKRGNFTIPSEIAGQSELIEFLQECSMAVVLQERKKIAFHDLFLNEQMNSGIALPIITKKQNIGVLFLNSRKENYYSKSSFNFMKSFSRQASGMLHNARLFRELKDYVKQVEELEQYQKSIFSSMTNLLITCDENDRIEYYNRQAKESLNLTEDHIGKDIQKAFEGAIGKKILSSFHKVRDTGQELLGLEGIYKRDNKEMDFSLNISPLRGMRGKHRGLTLLFTDQSKERQLKESADVAKEDRRVIKDMFARYLSNDIVQNLVNSPDLVKPGGGTKHATVFFADIRGYTSFSEDKTPEYIINVLNEYFTEAVEIVIKYGGYIDKFIGDCIMAAWGVPMVNEKEDAIKAVSCAVEIQNLVKSTKRNFFHGEAEHLAVGFGMHTGDLVAGNLGSSRRMDYTVIGDTVNLAARLEGVSGAGEIIITEDTRQHLDDRFILEKRKAVKVKGKIKPIEIYNVAGMV